MNDFETITEENDNFLEEKNEETPSKGDLFEYEEEIIITKVT